MASGGLGLPPTGQIRPLTDRAGRPHPAAVPSLHSCPCLGLPRPVAVALTLLWCRPAVVAHLVSPAPQRLPPSCRGAVQLWSPPPGRAPRLPSLGRSRPASVAVLLWLPSPGRAPPRPRLGRPRRASTAAAQPCSTSTPPCRGRPYPAALYLNPTLAVPAQPRSHPPRRRCSSGGRVGPAEVGSR